MKICKSIEIVSGETRRMIEGVNGTFYDGDVTVELRNSIEGVKCYLTAEKTRVSYITLYIEQDFSPKTKILGDTWERSYGDLCWEPLPVKRILPWYFFAYDEETAGVYAYGVKVRPAAFCAWSIQEKKLALTLDVCNGTEGVELCGRKLLMAEILAKRYDASPFSAARDFCKMMCTDAIMPKIPVYGGNNWYYTYGKSSQKQILLDAEKIAHLSKDIETPPYMIIDDCWSVNSCAGPWDVLRDTFTDMKKLAQDIKEIGVKPGIWLRPLSYKNYNFPREWYLRTVVDGGEIVDITVPAARRFVLENFIRLKEWGYELIKYDFTTFDIFGGFSFEFSGFMSQSKNKWQFFDKSKTNAEILVEFYKDIREVTQGVLLMGCNTVSHLIAGLVEIQRTGDDTSGVEWERTRKMGVNTLAFRLCQHGAFYAVDADCVGITSTIPWEQNREWLNLLAGSGTPLFVSLHPDCMTETVVEDIQRAFCVNVTDTAVAEPLDWMETSTPEIWRICGKEQTFNWSKTQ